MKKVIYYLLAIIIFLSISACSISTSPSLNMTPSLSVTESPAPIVTQTPSPTSSTPEVPALVKTSLEFYRNGKTYEIIVGYAVGDAFGYATPRPKFPEKWFEAGANSAELERYGDFDYDGEREFIVSLMYCGAYCSESIQVYEYDAKNDKYNVADEFGTKYPAVDEYVDINVDQSLEIITSNFGFCYNCSTASLALSALMILRYENSKFVDVTTEFPELIFQDADLFLESAKANEQDAAAITLPAYLYNMYRLGRIDEARPIFDHVCAIVLKPNLSNFDCAQFRTKVEKAITEFKIQK